MWIDTTSELARVCDELKDAPYITLDTEFVRVKSYLPRLCLLQLGTGGEGVVVDCLAKGLSLEPVRSLLLDTSMPKVIHAASQDLRFFRDLWSGAHAGFRHAGSGCVPRVGGPNRICQSHSSPFASGGG